MKMIMVMGPTASGKSEIALQLAEELNGVIVNADSIQQYQGLRIGSASPSDVELSRVPHYLFGWIPLGQTATLGDYHRRCMQTLADLEAKKTPYAIVVGGTGFYLQAIEKGLFPIPPKDLQVQDRLERELEQLGELALFQRLQGLDPIVARRIAPQDHYRLIRFLEIIEVTGKTISEIEDEKARAPLQLPYRLLKLGVQRDKDELRARVVARTQKMFEQGWVDEVRDLVAMNLGDWPPLDSVGYREVKDYILSSLESSTKGATFPEAALAQCQDAVIKSTMKLIKKQGTWFRKEKNIFWVQDFHEAKAKVCGELT